MKYRIMKTDDGKFVAQVKRGLLDNWDDIFYAGVLGLVKYSDYKSRMGLHNNRYSDTIEACERIIEEHKRIVLRENGGNLTLIKEYD